MRASFDDIQGRAAEYHDPRGMRLGPRLGFGKDGTVFSTIGSSRDVTAVKLFVRADLFERELAVYRRLTERGVAGTSRVCGHNIPRLIDHDRDLLIVELSIVSRPFVLDFAGGYLDDTGPKFDEEIQAMALARWRERFGDKWPRARQIIFAFAQMGIDLTDPSPTNIGFVEG